MSITKDFYKNFSPVPVVENGDAVANGGTKITDSCDTIILPAAKRKEAEAVEETSVALLDEHDSGDGELNINLVFTTIIVCFGSSFVFGYNIGVLNNVSAFIIEFYNETYAQRSGSDVSAETITTLWSLTTALLIPGAVVGSFLSGWMADTIGRKWTIIVAQAFTISGAILSTACVAASAPEMLMIGRLLVGFTSGYSTTVTPMILSEIAPSKYRGAFGTVHQLSATIGIFLASVFGLRQLLGTQELWQYILLLEMFPAIVTIAVLPCLPETPRFLLLVRRDEPGALKAMKFYRKSENVDKEMNEMANEGGTGKSAAADAKFAEADVSMPLTEKSTPGESPTVSSDESDQKSYSLLQLLRDTDLRKPLFIACMLVVIQQFSGINAVFFYSASIFQNAKLPESFIPYAVIGTNAVNVAMTVIAVPLMDMAGRRILLIVPMIVMIVDLIMMTICLVYQEAVPTLGYISVVCIIIYVICFAVGLGPIPLFIGSEMFRQGPRSMVMTLVGVILWLATFVIAMVFEHLQKAADEYTFIVFIVLLAGFVVFIILLVPETKNKSFEEIASQYSKAKSPSKSSSPSSHSPSDEKNFV